MASLDSSGATGGVLELPGDDYFIYGPAEVHRSALSTACVPVHEHAGRCLQIADEHKMNVCPSIARVCSV